MSDKRFARVSNDPRFKKAARKHRKVKIDSRFQRMFTDKTFTTKYFVNKRGAALGKTTKEDLHQFYALSDDENSTEQQKHKTIEADLKVQQTEKKEKKTKKPTTKKENKLLKEKEQAKHEEKEEDDADNLETDDDSSDDEDGHDPTIDLARGEGNIESSSSSSDDSDDHGDDNQDEGASSSKISSKKQNIQNEPDGDSDTDETDQSDQEDEIDHCWAELDSNVKKDSNTSRRLAVCNLDWDRITASDLFVLFGSLKTKGIIKSIKIYPSEFGLQRLKNEECYGPEELVQQNTTKDNNSNIEGEEFSREKLRQYQINRLKYFYAVVDCDSPNTADEIYSEYDGVEFELSGNKLDLRFIPEDMEFDHEPTSVATELPSQSLYAPPEFETTALHQTNVKLTWDETDSQRIKTTMRSFSKDEIENMDFDAYLASSSDDDDDNEDNDIDDKDIDEDESIAKYKSLVQELDAKERGDDDSNEMEITWEPGLKESALDLVAKKKAEKEQQNATPWEKYLNRKKEKRKEKRKQKNNDEVQDSDDEEVDGTPVDMSDPFFTQEYGPKNPRHQQKNTKKNTKSTKDRNTEDKKQKDELELLLMDENDDREHFSLKGIIDNEKKKKKRKKRRKEEETKQDTFAVNVDDPRFSALFSSHLYAIDPSDPQFKETKAMSTILEERQRRRSKKRDTDNNDETGTSTNTTGKKSIKDPSLSFLVNSVKSKAGAFHQRKKKRKHSN